VTDPRRGIPPVDRLLATAAFEPLLARTTRERVAEAVRAVQDALRAELAAGSGSAPADPVWYAAAAEARLDAAERPSLRRVINATGVVLHTNLGRAPLAEVARAALAEAATSYTNLEYDLEAGARGSRYEHCTSLLRELTGAEAALVVNNNAAAVVLALNTLAQGREAVISRGELVEIGGSFRVPEIMARSGAMMREVGATNRTHLSDYEAAVDGAGAILHVHRSNFRITGFTAEVPLGRLVALGREHGVPVIADLGSGLLLDPASFGLAGEPTAAEVVAMGPAVVTMSGDKLLGGPQAGLIVGSAAAVDAMRRNPLCRALRVDKLTLAALEATLALYREPDRAMREIPTLAMLSTPKEAVAERARALADRLDAAGVRAHVRDGASTVGGGAFPDAEIPTALLALEAEDVESAHGALRSGEPPVVGRIRDGRLLLDLRTVRPDEEETLHEALARVLA